MSTRDKPTGTVLVVYHGTPAALVSARQVSFVGDVRHLPPGAPVVRVVAHMAYYAQLVLASELRGPYNDRDAERFARFALIDPEDFAAHSTGSDDAIAAHFRIPVEQIDQARQELNG